MAKRILIIDDDPDIQDMAGLGLRLAGWDVLSATSSRVGLELATMERPDAILLDVMMPDLDGPATFRLLQANEATRGIPVILLSAAYHSSGSTMFDELAVSAKLPKPFKPLQLPRQIAEILGWPRD